MFFVNIDENNNNNVKESGMQSRERKSPNKINRRKQEKNNKVNGNQKDTRQNSRLIKTKFKNCRTDKTNPI